MAGINRPFCKLPSAGTLTLQQFLAGASLDDRISSVHTNNLSYDWRLDSEHYKPEYLQIEQSLQNLNVVEWQELDGRFIIGPFGSAFTVDKYVPHSSFRYIRGKDVKPFFLRDNDNAHMPKEDYKRLEKYALLENDLLVSVVGTLGNVSVIDEKVGNAIFSCKSAAFRSNAIDPHYLMAYLNSTIGQSFFQRRARGAIQLGLNLSDLKTLPIFLATPNQQIEIGNSIRKAASLRDESERLYAEAERVLLAALGLDTLDLSPQLSFTAMWDDVDSAERIDARYYQPMYQQAMSIMRRSGKVIADVARHQVRRFYPTKGTPFEYIEIGNVSDSGSVVSEPVQGEDAPNRAQYIVKSGDVITSSVRPIRRLSALIEPEQSNSVCTSGFIVLEPFAIPSELLLVYLRLPIVAEILDLHSTASMYPAIAPADLMRIPISIPNQPIVEQVVQMIKESRVARVQAKQLLDQAKQRVEQLILEGEN